MATAWQTLEEAALTLGISSRTLSRRMARGEFETRMENGRREVLISITEPELAPKAELSGSASDSVSDTATDMSDTTDNADQPQFIESQSDDVGHTMLALHEDRIRRTDLAIMAYQQSVNVIAADARRTHRNARLAWSLAGGLAAITFVASIWATHSVTQAQAEVGHLNTVVRQLSDTSDSKSRDVEKLRTDAEAARLATAKAEGRLEAAKTRIDQLTLEQAALQSKVAVASVTAAPILASSVTIPATQPATTQPLTTAR
jgi:outer membrane murein-binding lipoprotein Lpp